MESRGRERQFGQGNGNEVNASGKCMIQCRSGTAKCRSEEGGGRA